MELAVGCGLVIVIMREARDRFFHEGKMMASTLVLVPKGKRPPQPEKSRFLAGRRPLVITNQKGSAPDRHNWKSCPDAKSRRTEIFGAAMPLALEARDGG